MSTEKVPNLKLRILFYLADTEDLGPEHNLSNSSQGLLWKDKGGSRIYRSLLQKKTNKQKKSTFPKGFNQNPESMQQNIQNVLDKNHNYSINKELEK